MATAIKIGPADHGRRMALAEFDHAEVRDGHCYELGRGVISVSDVPSHRHLIIVRETRQHFSDYRALHPGRIDTIAGGGECKILLTELQSERHPDIAIYRTPPEDDGADLWSTWIPEIVVEVVSAGSEFRDYVEKRQEYLAFGVKEYWIIDPEKEEMLVLRRSGGQWVERVLRAADTWQTRLLPGFHLPLSAILEAAREAR